MNITRYGTTDGANGLPIISGAVVRGDMVYLCGVRPDPAGDIEAQTQQVVDRIDHLLQTAGTDKSKLLTAQVWLDVKKRGSLLCQRVELTYTLVARHHLCQVATAWSANGQLRPCRRVVYAMPKIAFSRFGTVAARFV